VIEQKIETALNNQMNREFYSYYLYLAMAAHFESTNLKGFANWMRIQAREEESHAMKIYEHLIDRGGKVMLKPIEAPPSEWKSSKEVFENSYRHEQEVTKMITQLVDLAKSERDHLTEIFLQWFVKEQVEEEASAYEIAQKLQLVGNDSAALFILDMDLGRRQPEKEGKE